MDDIMYLDNCATTKPCSEAVSAIREALDKFWFNPSALYRQSAEVGQKMKDIRKSIAKTLNVREDEIYFNSGGTEGDNQALFGALSGSKKEIIVSTIEHSAVYQSCLRAEEMGCTVKWIKPESDSRISVNAVTEAVTEKTHIISIMHVNNETGAVNDIELIAKAAKKINPKVIFHSDGVQGFLKLPLDLGASQIDIYNFSAHKIHGPKGAGGIYIKKGTPVKPIHYGGPHENGLRAGTENVPGIMGMGAAVREFAPSIITRRNETKKIKQGFIDCIKSVPDVVINGGEDEENYSPYVLNVSPFGVRGETLLHMLEENNILVATGSACSSHKKGTSRVLSEMGIPDEVAQSAIRISFGFNQSYDLDRFADVFKKSVMKLRQYRRH